MKWKSSEASNHASRICDSSTEQESVHKKKKNKKRSVEDETNVIDQHVDNISDAKHPDKLASVSAPNSFVKSKEEKRRKRISDSTDQGRKHASSEILEECSGGIASKSEVNESDKKRKEKQKKKNKLVSDAARGTAGWHPVEVLTGTVEEKPEDSLPSETKNESDYRTNIKLQDKKKKKNRSVNSLLNNVKKDDMEANIKIKGKKRRKDGLASESSPGDGADTAEHMTEPSIEMSKDKKKNKNQTSASLDVSLEKCAAEENGKSIKKKRKKNRLVSTSLLGEDDDIIDNQFTEELTGTVKEKSKERQSSKMENAAEKIAKDKKRKKSESSVSHVDIVEDHDLGMMDSETSIDAERDNKLKKKKKQKGQVGSIGHNFEQSTTGEENIESEGKRMKTDRSGKFNTGEQLAKDNSPLDNNPRAGKKNKDDNVGGNFSSQKAPSKKPNLQESRDVQKDGERSMEQKNSRCRHNCSNEPKTVQAFQRVKVDEVEFVDERLRDNSYWAKGGAEVGYGAKAQEILGQVRGRNFQHVKTKKKRGSYRGGNIDLQSHSIKFNYSDDE